MDVVQDPAQAQAAQQQAAQLVDGVHTAGKFTGGIFPEEPRRKIDQPGQHRGFHRHRRFGFQARHGQRPHRGNQQGRNRGADDENADAKQHGQVSVLQHKTGQQPREPGHHHADQGGEQRQGADHDQIRHGEAVLQIDEEIPDSEGLLGQGTIEAYRVRLKKILCFPADRHPLSRGGIAVPVSRKGSGKQRDRPAVLLAEGQNRAHGIPVPALFELDHPAHNPIGTQAEFHLLVILHIRRDFRRFMVEILQDFVNRRL